MKNIHKEEVPREKTPFKSIALAFSGGGFRAAAFATGILSYLNKLEQKDGRPLLENVTFISSASGGTIANAMYALNSASGKSFDDYYRASFENLRGTRLLDHVFRILNEDKQWTDRPGKKRNMINAFALAYDTCLFGGKFLGDLYAEGSDTHLEEVCFNTTEFYKGLLFRQNIKMQYDPRGKEDKRFRYGNFTINLEKSVATKLKLSDLLAASSCFPAGFEPIIFPDDFTYNMAKTEEYGNESLKADTLVQGLYIQLRQMNREELYRIYGPEKTDTVIRELPGHPTPEQITAAFRNVPKTPALKFGFMDGGITDNQALESILDAQERRFAGNETSFAPFDLMLINDVGSDFMTPWVPPAEKSPYTGWRGITILTTVIIMSLLFLGGIALITAGFNMIFATSFSNNLAISLGSVLTLVSSLIIAGLLLIRSYIKGNIGTIGGLNLDKNFSRPIVDNLFRHFSRTPVMVIFRMLNERISSLLVLNNDVFLKRIRFLLYNSAYESKRYFYTLKSNHIYDLSFSNDFESSRHTIPDLIPGIQIKKIAQLAFEMGTTLWFDQKNQADETKAVIIACGQFTTCYNLLKYIHKLRTSYGNEPSCYSSLPEEYKEAIDHLEKKLKEDFRSFNSEPFWMYNLYGEELKIDGFRELFAQNYPFPQEFNGLR